LISEPKQWLNYAKKEVLKIVQASFNFFLGIYSTKGSDFERNLDLKIRCESQTSGRQTQGRRRLLITSNFQIKISFKLKVLMEMLPKINQRKLAQFFRPPSLRNFAASLV